MDEIVFLGLLLLVFVGLPLGLGLLFYFIPVKLGFPNTAKYLTIVYSFIVIASGLFLVFEDLFFSKNDAKKLIEEQGILLTDQFDLVKNESMSGIGDYYHTFTLRIGATIPF